MRKPARMRAISLYACMWEQVATTDAEARMAKEENAMLQAKMKKTKAAVSALFPSFAEERHCVCMRVRVCVCLCYRINR
jgi:hypothetical protein